MLSAALLPGIVDGFCDFENGYKAQGKEVYVPGPTTKEECACLAKKVKGAVGASIKNGEECYAKFEKVGYTGNRSHYGCDFDDIDDGELVNCGNDPDVHIEAHGLGKCEGDCDSDSDCADGLKCYQRDS
eukprot:gene14548-23857_t